MPEHRDPLDPHPEREALQALGVVAAFGDESVEVGVDHPRAEDLDPARALAQGVARAVRQRAAPPAGEAGHVGLDARLGEREVARPQPDLALAPEDRADELEQHALEVRQRDVLVHGEALDLVEHRRVRGIGVAPVDAAGDDHVHRRLVQLHGADLDRRGVRPEDDLVRHVERVLHRPRRMRGRHVERREVVVVELDLGPLGDREAERDEDVLDLAARLGDQVQVAVRQGRVAGQRHVHAVAREPLVELRSLEVAAALGQQRLDRLPDRVGDLADLATLLGRKLADRAQHARQLRAAAEEAHPRLVELGRGARPPDRGLGLLAKLLKPSRGIRHGRRSYSARTAPQRPPSPR